MSEMPLAEKLCLFRTEVADCVARIVQTKKIAKRAGNHPVTWSEIVEACDVMNQELDLLRHDARLRGMFSENKLVPSIKDGVVIVEEKTTVETAPEDLADYDH